MPAGFFTDLRHPDAIRTGRSAMARSVSADLHPRWEVGSEQKLNESRTSADAEGVDTGDADVEEQLREKALIAYRGIFESILKMEWDAGLQSRESEAIADSVVLA